MHGNIFEWCRDWHRMKLPGGIDPDLHDAQTAHSAIAPAISPASAAAAAGPTKAGRAAAPSGCASSRTAGPIISACESWQWS